MDRRAVTRGVGVVVVVVTGAVTCLVMVWLICVTGGSKTTDLPPPPLPGGEGDFLFRAAVEGGDGSAVVGLRLVFSRPWPDSLGLAASESS